MNIRMRTLPIGLAGLAGAMMMVLATPAAFAQKGDYATFFEDGDFRGYSFTLTNSESDFGRPGLMNDKVSSVRVRGRWLLCSDGDFRGRCEEVSGDLRDLNVIRLNDAISSARYLGPSGPNFGQGGLGNGPGYGPGFGGPGGGRPGFVDRDRLERDIDRAMDDRDWRRALNLIDQYSALPGKLPNHYLVIEARAALGDNDRRRASDALDDYYSRADKRDPDWRTARDLSKRIDRDRR